MAEPIRHAKPSATATAADSYYQLQLIREVELQLLEQFRAGKLHGTIHPCVGQEACAVGVLRHAHPGDLVTSTHRGHGHYLALTGDVRGLVGEIMGRATGVCQGRGGSQHLCRPNFLAGGITGGLIATATGAAWAEKSKGDRNIAIAFLGDGALGQGLLWECMNVASLQQLPILFVIENNRYAMSTSIREALAGDMERRVQGYAVDFVRSDGETLESISQSAQQAISRVRGESRPCALWIETYRLLGHSKSDPRVYRTREEEEAFREGEPIARLRSALDPAVAIEIQQRAHGVAVEAIAWSSAQPPQSVDTIEHGLFSPTHDPSAYECTSSLGQTHVTLLRSAMAEAIESQGAIVLGEDIADPFGGAFGVTAGLSTRYGQEHVRNTPISEAALMGIASGIAIRGIPTIVEIMFGDFLTLCTDQLVNHASKFNWIANGQMPVPVTVRTPMGGRRGYGPTHSQSLETLFAGVPGLKLVQCSALLDSRVLLSRAIRDPNPVLFLENKLLYTREFRPPEGLHVSSEYYPTARLSLGKPEVSIVAYGGAAEVALAAATLLAKEGLGIDLMVPSQISPLPERWLEEVAESAQQSGALCIVEESWQEYGLGAELTARLADRLWGKLRYPPRRLGSRGVPIPAQPSLEQAVLPSVERVRLELLELVE